MNIRICITAGLVAGIAVPAYASGQSTLASGYTLVSSCSGTGFGSFDQAGHLVSNGSAVGQNCASQTSATQGGSATVTTSNAGSNFGHAYSDSSTASASLGIFHLSATNSGSASTQFSGSQAMAGWNDTITIGGGTGQGIWLTKVHVDGTLASLGLGADSQFGVEIFKDHNVLQPYGPAINQAAFGLFQALDAPLNSNDVFYSWDYQMKPWRITSYTGDKTLTVDQDVYFAVPFTYGVSFTLGVFGQVGAGEAASGPYNGDNSSTVDFSHTVYWGGKGQVLSYSGNAVGGANPNFTITSGSGFNYNAAAAPEPASWAMMLAGFGLIGGAMRGRRRAMIAFA
jgi:hypothetical protein